MAEVAYGHRGPWAGFFVGEVFISSAPLVAADGVLVNTSVRKKEISASLNLSNSRGAAVKVKVSARCIHKQWIFHNWM